MPMAYACICRSDRFMIYAITFCVISEKGNSLPTAVVHTQDHESICPFDAACPLPLLLRCSRAAAVITDALEHPNGPLTPCS